LIKMGLRLRDIGSADLSWADLRDIIQHLPPDGTSALFRRNNPRTWWWSAEVDFSAALLHTGQLANWQRAGKGSQPKPIKKPIERALDAGTKGIEPQSAADLAERRAALKAKREGTA
jgi:hypothetical protein